MMRWHILVFKTPEVLQTPSPLRALASQAGLCLPMLPPILPPLIDAGIDAFDDDSKEEVESDAFDGSFSFELSWEGRAHSVNVWLSPRRYEMLDRLLFAYIDPPIPLAKVSGFLRAALAMVEPLMSVKFLPTTWGGMLFRCEDLVVRDTLRSHNPIFHEGDQPSMQRPNECSNRFYWVLPWLAYVHVLYFPNERWYDDKIKKAFAVFYEVVEIDPNCLTSDNFGTPCLLLEVNERLEIPYEVNVSTRLGCRRFGGVTRVRPICVWDRSDQLDDDGNLTPFFRHGPTRPPLGPQ